MVTALKIESRWSKDEILETYLNLISVHADIQGIGSTSLALFNKSPLYLNDSEQSVILKSIKAPNTILKNAPIQHDDFKSIASHYHTFLLKSKKYNQTSTLDYDLQNFAVQILKMHLEKLTNKNVHDAAIIVLDNHTNDVLAYVGGNLDTTQTPYVDMAQAERQMGSTLKPFLYSTALDQNILKISSWIEDSPIDIIFPNGTYSPKNHDQHFHGWVHIGTAIGSSLNVPAVKTIQLVGVDTFWNTLKKVNFNLERDPDFYGPSLALGVLDGSLWQLTHAYQNFVQTNDVFTEDTKQKMIWILSRSQNRAMTFGQDSILNVPQGFAVKTGTSKDMKDNWAVGFNRDFTVGVWVGNADSSSMQNVLGVTGAAPVWREMVDYLMSSKLKTDSVLITSEQDQKFLSEEQSAEGNFKFTLNTIISPAKNSIYAIDPSIPTQFQRILLQADGNQNNLTWKYKGEVLKDTKWALKKGWQKIELYSDNKKIDETVFLVK
jgi:penicillin-binding protein 1C